MGFAKFTFFEEDSQFSNIIEEEEYESEVTAFQGFQKGFSEEVEARDPDPKPWDPSEPAWTPLDDRKSYTDQ